MDNQTKQIQQAFNAVHAEMAHSLRLQMIQSLMIINANNSHRDPSVSELFDKFIDENREAIMNLSIEEVLKLISQLSESPE